MHRHKIVEVAFRGQERELFTWQLGDTSLPRFAFDDFAGLAGGGRPSERAQMSEPWAAVITVGGRAAASVSPSFTGGLFWASAGHGLVFSDSVRGLVGHLAGQVTLDPEFIRAFAVLDRGLSGTRTAFAQIHRVEPGTTAIWEPQAPRHSAQGRNPVWPRRPRTVVWCGPESWPEPHLHGPATPGEYLAAFDASIDGLINDGPLYVMMSGGLDSTFVAASLVRHATSERPVHALCHAPDPAAKLTAQGRWDPDDYPIAKAMEAAYPGRIVVHRVHAPPGRRPLDAAFDAASARGVPTLNPGNQVWITHLARIAARAGASRVFCGTNGNPAFSFGHPYAPGYYLRRGDPLNAWRSLLAEGERIPTSATLSTRALSPLAGTARQRLGNRAHRHLKRATGVEPMDYRAMVGLNHLGPAPLPPPMTRARYLEWLTGHGPYKAASMFPGSPVPVVDPFTTARMLTTAAAITPLEWLRGPGGTRTYARLLGAGRVPDSIRLRTRRGGQGWDEWYLIRNDRDRYFDEVQALASTPILGGWVDDGALRAILERWPWGQVHGPNRMSVLAMNRILSLAGFVRAGTGWVT